MRDDVLRDGEHISAGGRMIVSNVAGTREPEGGGAVGATCPHNFEAVEAPPPPPNCGL